MRSSADFRMELPSVGVVLVGTDTMADRGDSWTGDQREAGTSRWPPVGTWVWPPVDTFSWPRTLPGVRLARMRAAFLGAQGNLPFPQKGRLWAVRPLTGTPRCLDAAGVSPGRLTC